MITIDLGPDGLDRGGHLLLRQGLRAHDRVAVVSEHHALGPHLRAWCRAQGHALTWPDVGAPVVARGPAAEGRWEGAEDTGPVEDHPPPRWGLAARGSTVEAGMEGFHFPLSDKREVWTEDAARLYAVGAANQWDPETAIDWEAPFELPEAVEEAVVQVMTYLIENETAALIVPAGFLARLHPHFREVMQVLALQAADEARHVEVFTRRALLRRPRLGLSTVGGQRSLQTLIEEPDFALASFLLAVLGEGSFLNLLGFLQRHAPDPVTRQVCRLAAQDEARHVAFGMAHLSRHAREDPGLLGRLATAVTRRHAALSHTAGLNEEVYDALILLAAGRWSRDALARGFDAVVALKEEMDAGRRGRLRQLGFSEAEARALSALHTRNFM
ncbi:MAG: ferritin-like domain-containing protein [Alphaproteobacteria bacterium]|nr:ferritin-like domain-containing protein [Alphaproteobacteria bacterium]